MCTFPMHVPLAHRAMKLAYTPSSTRFSEVQVSGEEKKRVYGSSFQVRVITFTFSSIVYLYLRGPHAEQGREPRAGHLNPRVNG